tara:strand:- start:226 stop:645 length:420 start_codon:yes stop_codon:yes gene_type:complete
MNIKLILKDIKDISKIAKKILKYTKPYKKFLLYGEMGVGKTTLIKELSLQLGVVDMVSSPTFSIVNEYITLKNEKVYHFDFYRLDDKKEIFDLGYEEYFFGNDYCFVEWPEKIVSLIGSDLVTIKIYINDNKRIVEIIF